MTIIIPNWLADRVEVDENGCWLWQQFITQNRYGLIRIDGSKRGAHRGVYQRLVGPIPEGHELDHLCRVRHCVNPEHLEPVTHLENVRRSPVIMARRERCVAGHEFSENNTYVSPDGRHHCRECCRARSRKWKAKQATERLSEFDERVLTVDEIAAEDDALALSPAGVDVETGEVEVR
jgi:hypothetical protein